ncbi:Rieske (2Fe-2S) protein [Actinotalea sp. Marseille-Q4924]|uniref:Rieske (2Fe-2S) protein n=1 Tax=Actinotalea sp. Marseille-Q4924 TaxID=2866571 RepID=UPI001CE3E228|nr:Rieske (2Fe-2S) protein [Actinotalea sp. Marseille-Q4924]
MSPTRRHVLTGAAGAAAGACLLAACGASGGDRPAEGGAPEPDEGATTGGDDGAGSGALTALADVPVGGAVLVTSSSGLKVLVAQPVEGEVVGYSSVCTHQGCTVAPAGSELACPCHGSVFDVATGEPLEGPATEPLVPFEVRVEGGDVLEA